MKHKQIGFEFEIGSPWTIATTRNKMARELGLRGLKDEVDTTVETPQKYNGEIVTPVWTFRQGMVNLKRIFKWFEKNGIVTNMSCGFHVNLSFKQKELNWMMDNTRLVMCFNEEKWLKICKRHNNEWAGCYMDKLIVNSARKKFTNETKVIEWINKEVEELVDEKYHTVHLGHLEENNPYVEYRCLGGVGYHLRFNVMAKAIIDMSKNLDRALPEGKGSGFMTIKVRECFLPRKKRIMIPH